jgi:hypothetical protein
MTIPRSILYSFLAVATAAACHHDSASSGGTIPSSVDGTGNTRATIQPGADTPYNEGTSSGTNPAQSAGPHTPGTGAGTTPGGGATQETGTAPTGPNGPGAVAPSNVGGSQTPGKSGGNSGY